METTIITTTLTNKHINYKVSVFFVVAHRINPKLREANKTTTKKTQ